MKKVNSNKNEKKGKSVKADKTLMPPPAPTEFKEHVFAERFISKIGKIRTCGKSWYRYRDGIWECVDMQIFSPVVLDDLPPQIKTAGNVTKVLRHVQLKCQVDKSYFRGFYGFDANGDILVNSANGVVKISKQGVELLDQSSDFNFTQKTKAKYDTKAKCSLFDYQLQWILSDRKDCELFELCGGNILIPDARFETACVLYGLTGTGKSTLMNAISYALGTDIVREVSMTQLNTKNTYFLTELQDMALNVCTELETHEIKDTSIFKKIISGERSSCRKIHKTPMVLTPTVKLFYLTNHIPAFVKGNGAEARRLRILHFDRKPKTLDNTLRKRLEAEADGIFLRMVQWAQKLLSLPAIPEGGVKSQSVKRVFAISNDPIGTFVNECCETGPKNKVTKDELVDAYTAYCDSNSLVPVDRNIFLKDLYKRFPTIDPKRVAQEGNRVQMVSGLRLIEAPEKNN